MERKPVPVQNSGAPAMATGTSPAQPQPQPPVPAPIAPEVLEWEQPSTTKKGGLFSKFSKFNLFGASASTKSTDASIEEGRVQPLSEEKEISQSTAAPARLFGRNRKKVLIIGGVALLLLILILGLGLGLGLKKKSKKYQNLPLPGSSSIQTGDLTYYSPGPGYGACGFENTSHDSICAVSHIIWDAVSTSSNPNHNPLCGKMLRITRFNEALGRNSSVDVEVVDRCTGCEPNDIDLSLDMFTALADEGQGRVLGSWAWLD
ncbi:hypothetical protein HYFRA_00011672 [Hymenoscyphus fraxineus]|uniref:Barwin domain-containing protein n=1 Tax=Hymenoscyphus fraxineus TaxID=746836 RepID=A0A9N9KZY1_9HELO|nr:hypothetical protein HYFRA_00011672 [Hymenoscyphus fraxineus]